MHLYEVTWIENGQLKTGWIRARSQDGCFKVMEAVNILSEAEDFRICWMKPVNWQDIKMDTNCLNFKVSDIIKPVS